MLRGLKRLLRLEKREILNRKNRKIRIKLNGKTRLEIRTGRKLRTKFQREISYRPKICDSFEFETRQVFLGLL
jgi:hypothetical protein